VQAIHKIDILLAEGQNLGARMKIDNFFAELKRRNVYKVGVAMPTMHPFAKAVEKSSPRLR